MSGVTRMGLWVEESGDVLQTVAWLVEGPLPLFGHRRASEPVRAGRDK